ncbi:MAG: hypothetical protein Kow00123_26110 [Anaerolineales bacterium]
MAQEALEQRHTPRRNCAAEPWGQARYSDGTTPTTYRFTGQREESKIGLYFYNARWYDPALGRFTQPDTLVPEPGNPQALNRYAYTLNNPVRYTDPSGHASDAGGAYDDFNPDRKGRPNPSGSSQRERHPDADTQNILVTDATVAPSPWGEMSEEAFNLVSYQSKKLYAENGHSLVQMVWGDPEGPRNNELKAEEIKGLPASVTVINATNRTFQSFLIALNLDPQAYPNYEPSYLSALIVANPRAYEKAWSATRLIGFEESAKGNLCRLLGSRTHVRPWDPGLWLLTQRSPNE